MASPELDTILTLGSRVSQLEAVVQRVRDEVEACAVLALALDAGGSGNAGGQDSSSQGAAPRRDETYLLEARLQVLEDAWALRSSSVTKHVEGEIAKMEREVQSLWREVRLQANGHLPSLQESESRIDAEIQALRKDLATLKLSSADAVEALVQRLIAEVGRSVDSLGTRLEKVEVSVERLRAGEMAHEVDRERAQQLERMIELITQQRLEDTQQSKAKFRDIDSRFRVTEGREQQEMSRSWRTEADSIKAEIEDLRSRKIPSIFQQSNRAARATVEGLQALRSELTRLQEQVDGRPRSAGEKGWREGFRALEDSIETEAMIFALKTEVADLREQVTEQIFGGLDARFLQLRTEIAAEVSQVIQQTREYWGVTNRRLVALEAWPAEQSALHADLRALRADRQQDHVILEMVNQSSLELEKRLQSMQQGERAPMALDRGRPEAEAPNSPLSSLWPFGGTTGGAESNSLTPRSRIGLPPSGGRASRGRSRGDEAMQPESPRAGRFASRSPGPPTPTPPTPTLLPTTPTVAAPRAEDGAVPGAARPLIMASRVEWSLAAVALSISRQRAAAGGALLVTGELEVNGVPCRLKFFPDGSPLRQKDGFCSLYLLVLQPGLYIRFRLFAGQHSSPVLEANTLRGRRDQGRHDLCLLSDAMEADGSVTVGAEFLEVRAAEPD